MGVVIPMPLLSDRGLLQQTMLLLLLLLLLEHPFGTLARAGEALAAAHHPRSRTVNPLRGLYPLAKPHFSYPPDIDLLNNPAGEELLLDFIRVTGSLTPPSANDQSTVHRTVQLCVLCPPAGARARRVHRRAHYGPLRHYGPLHH